MRSFPGLYCFQLAFHLDKDKKDKKQLLSKGKAYCIQLGVCKDYTQDTRTGWQLTSKSMTEAPTSCSLTSAFCSSSLCHRRSINRVEGCSDSATPAYSCNRWSSSSFMRTNDCWLSSSEQTCQELQSSQSPLPSTASGQS